MKLLNKKNNNEQENLSSNETENISQTNSIIPSIIPYNTDNQNNIQSISNTNQLVDTTNNMISLESKDDKLKNDGVVVIGNVINEDEINVLPLAKLPVPIDIKARKKEQQRNKESKKKTYKIKKQTSPSQKGQTIVALGAILVICFLIGCFLYIKLGPKDTDFKLNNITVEYMEETYPKKVGAYVVSNNGEIIDELQYTLDLTEVGEEIGIYNYKVTYKGVTKTGTIEIVDRKTPNLVVRSVAITIGEPYTAYQFATSCYDHSGCNIFFEDSTVEKKYSKPGIYGPIQISAVDAYNNKTTAQAMLTILKKPYIFEKIETNEAENYILTTTYKIHFQDMTLGNNTISNIYCDEIICGSVTKVYKYTDDISYQNEYNNHYGEQGYAMNEYEKTITYTDDNIDTIGTSQYREENKVIEYLTNEGFILKKMD